MSNEPTQALDLVLRRCAAYMTLSEVLEGETLMNALWMLEERDHSADKITFISFFGVTAELLGINSNIINTLYAKLNKNLSLSNDQLPHDPLPEMLKYRGIEKEADNSISSATDNDIKVEEKERKPAGKIKGTAEMLIGVTLIGYIVKAAGYPGADNYSLFKEVFEEEINDSSLDDEVKTQMLAWVDALSKKVFKKNYTEDQLSKIVHCVYIALCEAEGPVNADGLVAVAIEKTEQISAAKLYSPRKFL